MSEALVKFAMQMADIDQRMLDWHEQKERDLLKAIRDTGYFFFAGEKVYFVEARTGRLTNGDPYPPQDAPVTG